MRLKLTLFLLVLNLVLFGIIYLIEKESSGDLPGVGPVLSAGLVDNCDYLEIEGQDLNAHWILRKNGEDWRIAAPIEWPANFFAVSRILNQLQFLEKESSFTVREIENAGRTLGDYGLDEPRAILTLGRGREKTVLKIGEATGTGERLYILSPDQSEVLVVSRGLLESISLELTDLRESKVFHIPLFEARALRVAVSPGNTIVRIEKNDNKWNFLTPIQTGADPVLVETTINRLTAIRVTDFLPSDLQGQGLDDSSISLRVSIEGNNRRQTLLLGNIIPINSGPSRRFAKLSDNDTVFSVLAEPFDNLLRAQKTLREKKFVQFNPASLNEIEIASGQKRVNLQKFEAGGWQLPIKDDAGALHAWSAEPSLVNELMDALLEMKAVSFPKNAPSEADLEQFGINDPQRRVTLHANGEQILLLGDLDPSGELIYAKMEAKPFVYQVPVEILRHLQARALHFRFRTFHNQPKSALIESIALRDLESGETLFVLDRQAGGDIGGNTDIAVMGKEMGFADALDLLDENERKAAQTLLEYSNRFKVKSYLKTEFSGDFNLGDKVLPWKYLLESKISLPGGAENQLRIYNFYFTDRIGGTTQIGGSPEYNLIFELSQDLIEALYTLAFRRHVPGLQDVAPQPIPETAPVDETGGRPPTAEPLPDSIEETESDQDEE